MYSVNPLMVFKCFRKKEKITDVTLDDAMLIIWRDPNLDGLSKIIPYRDSVPGVHGLLMTLLYYKSSLRDHRIQWYYDQHIDYMSAIEEAENFVHDVCVTPRTSKRISMQLAYNYIVTKDQKILDVLCDSSDHYTDMYVMYNKLMVYNELSL